METNSGQLMKRIDHRWARGVSLRRFADGSCIRISVGSGGVASDRICIFVIWRR